ncbi:distal tail protein Dit [Terrisporobacter mayombei]|uniref:SH3b domain-containing protein n=1 Tax=Terrisporobacter mayombei TaxID=1541 RepID=A0ABY9PZB1_9FIRM|nr:distal tail protein Dit [Terrisporobacter mayombei]MCC3868515.1 phage tail family protein [Terrisporobacter mayombei]WMT80671.1 hypothetical protein TEMA_09920 [Terrisporobacter mayombei]
MSYYLKYNETVLSDEYIVTKITKNTLPKKVVDTIDIASRDGKLFNGCKYDSLEYKVELLIKGVDEYDYAVLKKDLKDVLLVRYEVPISLNKDKTGFGLCTSEVTIEDKSDNIGVANFNILCFEPYFYNNEESLFENKEGEKEITVTNYGGEPVKPFVSVGFTKGAHFLQLENTRTQEQMLIGKYPNIELSAAAKVHYVMKDNCMDLTPWVPSLATLAPGRGTGGTLALSSISGGSFILGTFPNDTTNKWKGSAYRRNLNDGVNDVAVDNFEANLGFTFKSTGKNGDPSNYKYRDEEQTIISGEAHDGYRSTISSLNVRTGAGTKYKKLGTVKKNYEIKEGWTLVNGWVKFKDEKNFKGKTCYVSTKYLKKFSWTTEVKTIVRNYVTIRPTPIRDKPKMTGKKLASIPAYTCIRCDTKIYSNTDSDNVVRWWMKLYNKYNGVMGYICFGNVGEAEKVNFVQEVEFESADDLTGMCEFYGMSANGAQLFRVEVYDSTEWYEANRPMVLVGGREISDWTPTPAPKKKVTNTATADSNKNSFEVGYYRGGEYGTWNDLDGEWYIKRVKNENGSYTWKFQLRRIKNGVVTQSKTFNYTSKDYGADKLAYIVIYIGGLSTDIKKLCSMSINDIKIKTTDSLTDPSNENIEYFDEGDILDIDFSNRKVYLNQSPANDLLDIGSRFFDIDTGDTEVKFVSDDTNIVIGTTIREKWVGDE